MNVESEMSSASTLRPSAFLLSQSRFFDRFEAFQTIMYLPGSR